jgi:hypothetical protein
VAKSHFVSVGSRLRLDGDPCNVTEIRGNTLSLSCNKHGATTMTIAELFDQRASLPKGLTRQRGITSHHRLFAGVDDTQLPAVSSVDLWIRYDVATRAVLDYLLIGIADPPSR